MKDDLIYRFLKGECTEEEITYLHDKLNRQEDEDLFTNEENDNDVIKTLDNSAAEALYKRVYDVSVKKERRNRRIRKIGIMTCSILMIFFAAKYFYISSSSPHANFEVFYYANESDTIEITKMADGSIVSIYPSSKIYFTSNYNVQNREISLTGKASFNVFKNKEKPFVVKCENLLTTALGTEFIVDGYKKNVIVHLIEGKVIVKTIVKEEGCEQYLYAGQSIKYLTEINKFTSDINLRLSNESLVVRSESKEIKETAENVNNIILERKEKPLESKYIIPSRGDNRNIKTHMLVYNNQNLKQILTRLSQKYKVSINFPTDLTTNTNTYISIDSSQTIEKILRNIAELNGLKVNQISDKSYYISK